MSQAGHINIRRQAVISFTGMVVDAGISFLGLIAMAYVLGAAGLGRYYLVVTIVNVALFPVKGLGQAVLKRGSEEQHGPAEIFGTGLVMTLAYVTVLLAVLGLAVASGRFPSVFEWNIFLVAGALFAANSILNLQIDAYRSYGHTGYATIVDNAHGILQTILQLAVLVLGYEIFGLLAATVGATLVTIVVHYGISVVSFSRPRWSAALRLSSYARWSVLSSGVSTVYQRFPVLALGFVGMDAAVGYYSSANQLLMLGSFVGGSIAPALMAKTSSRTSGISTKELYDEFRGVHHQVTVISVPCVFGAVALSQPLMATFFGMTAPLAATALVGLSLYHVIYALTNVEYSFLKGLDLPELKTRSTALGLIVQAVLFAVLFPTFNFIGLITAFVLSQLVIFIFAQVTFWNRFQTVPLPGGLLTQTGSALVMLGVVEAVQYAVPVTSAVRLVITVGIGAVVYFGVLVLVDSEFRTVAKASVRDVMEAVT